MYEYFQTMHFFRITNLWWYIGFLQQLVLNRKPCCSSWRFPRMTWQFLLTVCRAYWVRLRISWVSQDHGWHCVLNFCSCDVVFIESIMGTLSFFAAVYGGKGGGGWLGGGPAKKAAEESKMSGCSESFSRIPLIGCIVFDWADASLDCVLCNDWLEEGKDMDALKICSSQSSALLVVEREVGSIVLEWSGWHFSQFAKPVNLKHDSFYKDTKDFLRRNSVLISVNKLNLRNACLKRLETCACIRFMLAAIWQWRCTNWCWPKRTAEGLLTSDCRAREVLHWITCWHAS